MKRTYSKSARTGKHNPGPGPTEVVCSGVAACREQVSPGAWASVPGGAEESKPSKGKNWT
jgi:hypothetical protein